ncbi:hypothetical protein JQ597_05220 [Bradyrhizobium sp. AUGA SZCCT0177]|uniref:hypothetical protein n=1 Tax=unclassified Bradyrhizobium TaxID=2631580 RepID=UPI001BA721F0|nr:MULTISPECIES: hypothetical protein [unclassified Bradyrhizobium]MBR1237132.1 hypothetical protein [Bradyrhizobium sp. AUGA SZCCT0182]MBR1281434.1 hypothetical protein [Bradyrhizobium sp. AUGA SZCCT0177]
MQIDPAFGLLTTDEAISRATKQVVASALGSTSSIDPIIGPEFSRAFSFVGLVVQQHGLLIQRVLADTLAASERFEVLTESPIPITAAALDLLTSENSEKHLASIKLKSDSRVVRSAMMDIIVIDQEKRWAGVYDVKRGNGETTWKSRKPIENDLRAARLVLQSHLKKLGHDVDHVDSAVIDYYGYSGFPRNIKINGEELDRHFGVPMATKIDSMTAALCDEVLAGLLQILEPMIAKLTTSRTKVAVEQPERTAPDQRTRVADILQARPRGPDQWHASLAR